MSKKANKKFYIAYGSNLNLEQMAYRCPTATVYGKGVIEGYELVFNGVASIEPKEGASVPVGVWEIDGDCEHSLDIYEGYPRLYRKELMKVKMHDGEIIEGMVYVMNAGRRMRALPSYTYYKCIEKGYDEIGLDKSYLKRAVGA